MIKVGDLVRMNGAPDWNGRMGIVTEISEDRMVWIQLTCGRVIATDRPCDMEAINESR